MRPLLVLAAAAALAAAALAVLGARSRASRPAPRAPGGLAPCPAAPNCVSSLAEDARHAVPPLRFDGEAEAAWRRLGTLVDALPGARRITQGPGRLHFEFRSSFFGFVDDVEFVLDPANRRIDVRSASRVGWSDLGANRRRVTDIARRFAAPESTGAAVPPTRG